MTKRTENNGLQYSGLAFEMLAFVLLGAWLGNEADEYYNSTNSVFLIAGVLSGLFLSFYVIFKKLLK